VKFAKLHGAGNDFLLFDASGETALAARLPGLVRRLCDRRLGIGADGVLLLLPRAEGDADLLYWNSDGSAAAFCANGTRCAARFSSIRWGWGRMVLRTGFAAIPVEVSGERVTLRLPAPAAVHPSAELEAPEGLVVGRYLVLGVPHLIVRVSWDDFWERPLAPLAPHLRSHPLLPEGGANVSFLRTAAAGGLDVRSWERGVEGETLSCGSGDVAAALVALERNWVEGAVAVRTASGRTLVVEAEGDPPDCPSRLSGAAEWVADGTVHPELLAVKNER
jgi:diaminopimelate epimerase